ncbi:MAG TPA: NAD-dependent epimerase/dehydratase family protein [Candidatus Methylomirabilis sp.]
MTQDGSAWREKRVCVTGGTGFLGFQIIERLVALGARVRSLSLPPALTHPVYRHESVEHCFGDIRDAPFVRAACAGCDVIFHTAGLLAVWGPSLARLYDVHVSGTRNVLEAAPPGARIVHTSSVVAVGASQGRFLTEEDPWNIPRLRVEYVQAKRAAEEQALASAAEGREVVVVNPGYLVGPEDHAGSIMGRFCLRFWKGKILVVPPGGLNLVDVRDVAVGHLLAAERGQSGRRYILGGENLLFPALVRLLASASGMRPRPIPTIPIWIEWLLAAAAEIRAGVRQREAYPSFQHVRLHRFTWFYDSRRAREELSFRPRALSESLRDAFEWFAARHSMQLRGIHRFWMRPEAG